MQRNDHPPGYRCCDLGTVVLADDVKRQVDRCSGAGRGEHLPIVNVEPPWIDLHRGIARCQFCRPRPVRGDAATTQPSAGTAAKGPCTKSYHPPPPSLALS